MSKLEDLSSASASSVVPPIESADRPRVVKPLQIIGGIGMVCEGDICEVPEVPAPISK